MDVLTLAGIEFDDYSTPSGIGAGGKQAMVVHKLPGGARVIDTLGPDEHAIVWEGQFFGPNALANAQVLDAVRAAGDVVPLTFGGMFRYVIVDDFRYLIRRYPNWVTYAISCTVYQNPMLGLLSDVTSTIDTFILSDIAAALALT